MSRRTEGHGSIFAFIENAFTMMYLALCAYCGLRYVMTEEEMALIIGLWAGLMLEVRRRHDITIQMFTKKENEDDDDGHGTK